MLDVLMATATLIAVISIFFLCYFLTQLNQQLKNNDEVIARLDNEISVLRASKQDMYTNHMKQIDALKTAHEAAATMRDKYADDIRIRDEKIKNKNRRLTQLKIDLLPFRQIIEEKRERMAEMRKEMNDAKNIKKLPQRTMRRIKKN
jgi:septal ring factor EnvC (AmiA/AmiB activator)